MATRVTKPRALTEGDTKIRLLDAADRLFIEHGAEQMSLRAVTGLAGVNIAAVNYHFGGKDRLLAAVLARRLDPLNEERSALLDACERHWPGPGLTCEHVLAALFVPALRQANEAGPEAMARLRFLGRAYSDSSAFTVAFLKQRYDNTGARFVEAFARALPDLPRADLKLRLVVVLRSVAGLIAGGDLPDLLAAFDRGAGSTDRRDARLLGSLGSLLAGALMAPPPARDRTRIFSAVFALAATQVDADPLEAAAPASRPTAAASVRTARTVRMSDRLKDADAAD